MQAAAKQRVGRRTVLHAQQQHGHQAALGAPSPEDAHEQGCARLALAVRMIKSVTSQGKMCMMVTNLCSALVPADAFIEPYHQRWRIEDPFKRLKHVQQLESVSRPGQHGLIIDVAPRCWPTTSPRCRWSS
jgi:hypothetical protein